MALPIRRSRGRLALLGALASLGACCALPSAQAGSERAPAPRIVLAVAPTGNDSSCTRGGRSRPCATFARAYRLARPGDVVEVAGGTYPEQLLLHDPAKSAPNVVFREARGQTAYVKGTLKIGNNTGNPSSGAPAQFVTFDGIDMDQVYLRYEGGAIRPRDVTLRNLHLGTKRETGLYAGSTVNLRLQNVDFGPTCCEEDGAQIAQGSPRDPQPSGTVLENVRFRDIRNNCRDIPRSVWPNCASESKPYAGGHVDCLQSTGGDNWTIRSSQFVNCQTGLQLGAEKAKWWNLLVENSFFDGFHPLNLGCGGPCSTPAFKAKTPAGERSYLKLYYNTLARGTSIEDVEPGGAYEMVGNLVGDLSNGGGRCIIPASRGQAQARFTRVTYNMFTGGAEACGSTNFNAKASFMNADERIGPVDLRLRPGSHGIGRGDPRFHPRRDGEGRLRPIRWPPDVGAWQHESAEIVLGRSIGSIRIGMKRDAVLRVYGPPGSSQNAKSRSNRAIVVAHYGRAGGEVRVTYDRRGTVVGVSTSSPYYTARSWLGVKGRARALPRGARWNACRRAYRVSRRGTLVEIGAARRTAKTIAWIGLVRPVFAAAC